MRKTFSMMQTAPDVNIGTECDPDSRQGVCGQRTGADDVEDERDGIEYDGHVETGDA